MIYDSKSLKIKYSEYSNINQKIAIEAKNNNLTRIKRGLYSDNIDIDAPVIANICCSPSYISFEYALSRYGLIPEYVSSFTSASFAKKNNNVYRTGSKTFEYMSIPKEVFPYGFLYMKNESGIRYKIASKEKALCDTLYSKYPVRSIKDLKILLFNDLRIDENEFYKLDFDSIVEICPLYHSNTLNTLMKFVKEINDENRY